MQFSPSYNTQEQKEQLTWDEVVKKVYAEEKQKLISHLTQNKTKIIEKITQLQWFMKIERPDEIISTAILRINWVSMEKEKEGDSTIRKNETESITTETLAYFDGEKIVIWKKYFDKQLSEQEERDLREIIKHELLHASLIDSRLVIWSLIEQNTNKRMMKEIIAEDFKPTSTKLSNLMQKIIKEQPDLEKEKNMTIKREKESEKEESDLNEMEDRTTFYYEQNAELYPIIRIAQDELPKELWKDIYNITVEDIKNLSKKYETTEGGSMHVRKLLYLYKWQEENIILLLQNIVEHKAKYNKTINQIIEYV